VSGPVESKESAAQLQTLNYSNRPRKMGIFLCLAGILAGGVAGELLRETLLSALHQHATFTSILNTPEVQNALALRRTSELSLASQVIQVKGPWVRDLLWQDGRVVYFVLDDGTFFFDAPRPPAWAFSFVVLCPLLGFLIPWGCIKAFSRMGVKYFVKKAPPTVDDSSTIPLRSNT
jgi:hypothetical protein